jgi:hypothetical protein
VSTAAEDRFMRDCESIGLGRAEPEYRFDESRRWRFDYAFPRLIAIEIDGASHSHPAKRKKDAEKRNAAACQGWLVLVFTPQQIRDGSWMDAAIEALVYRSCHPETVIADVLADHADTGLKAALERQLSNDDMPF